MILDKTEHIIENSQGIITFIGENGRGVIKEGKVSPFWTRYLCFNGEKIYDLGVGCGSCGCHFDRLQWSNKIVQNKIEASVKTIVTHLNAGLQKIGSETVETLSLIMPNGKYQILLTTIQPKLIVPGSKDDYFTHEQVDLVGPYSKGKPFDPQTNYYRLRTGTMLNDNDGGFFEFLMPTVSFDSLEKERIEYYQALLQKGAMPTAVSLSTISTLYPEGWKPETAILDQHTCLFHFLIDGHHKVYAAALAQKPLTLISFIALNQCMEDISEIIPLLETMP